MHSKCLEKLTQHMLCCQFVRHFDPDLELVTCSGHGKNGALCVLQRELRPQVVTTFELPGCSDMWTVISETEVGVVMSPWWVWLIVLIPFSPIGYGVRYIPPAESGGLHDGAPDRAGDHGARQLRIRHAGTHHLCQQHCGKALHHTGTHVGVGIARGIPLWDRHGGGGGGPVWVWPLSLACLGDRH